MADMTMAIGVASRAACSKRKGLLRGLPLQKPFIFVSLESPSAVLEERNLFAFIIGAHNRKVAGADHEVNVGERFVDAKGMQFFLGVFLIVRIKVSEATT